MYESITFDKGPAAAVSAMNVLAETFLALTGFTGAGLPQPIPTVSIPIVPQRSQCLIGFSVILPE